MRTTGSLLICWRTAIRPLFLHPRSTLLGIASIALGVAVFLAIAIANRGAVESFQNAFSLVTGKADLEVRGHIPEELFPAVLECSGVAAATPLIEAMVILPEQPGESLHLVGLDPFTAKGLMGLHPMMGLQDQEKMTEWLGTENSLAVTPEFLERHGKKTGDLLLLQGPGAPRRMRIAFEAGSDDAAAKSGGIAAMDIGAAQEWVGIPGELTSILVKVLHPEEREAVAERLRALMPADVVVEPPARRTKQVRIMLSAFRLNLTALSLVSLMVGIFFVGNTAAAAVVRRRVSIGILRAIGAGRPMITGMILLESGFCGCIGSVLGILASPVLAGILAAPVARTVTALYVPVEARASWPSPAEVAAGLVAGVSAALIAAWIPARQAARVDPTLVLHPGSAPEIFPLPSRPLALAGAGMLLCALLLSLGSLHGGPALLGFAAAFCVITGFSLMVPSVTSWTANRIRELAILPHVPGGAVIRLAVEQALRSLHRTAPTIAALAAAVAMTVGISVMIHSFRGSVVAWANRTLTADLFLAPAANELLGLAHTLPEGSAGWWSARPGVAAVGTFHEAEVRTTTGEPVTLGVVSGPARGTLDFLHGEVREKTGMLNRGEGIAISESLAQRLHLKSGDQLSLETPSGPLVLPVLDLYRDYTRDRGIALIDEDLYRHAWGVRGIHSLAIEFRKGTSAAQMDRDRAAYFSAFGGKESFACYSNRSLKDRILEIFNQTFAVTAVLRTISIAVAVGGVMLTLGILVLERSRDIGVLRSMGGSRSQIALIMMAEAVLIGLIASVIGLVSGAVLSLVLTWVINKAFFGWSIDLSYPWLELLLLPLWMTATSLVAGLMPAYRASSIQPATALRME